MDNFGDAFACRRAGVARAYDSPISGAMAARSAGGGRNTHTVSDSAASAMPMPAPNEQLLPTTRRPAIQLVGLSKRFGDVVAVDDIDLVIDDGEFFSLLGPSGSGKTTVLRLIAGFEEPTAGAVLLAGADVTSKPPYDRDLNTVFQDYALFPHLDVQRNVEYGLKVKGVRKAERRRRAGELLESVRLSGFASRRPNQLSGGQRQRVALARALVNHPKVLLLDEPLGALDLKLREEMQVELKALQRDVGITFVFVTHDQGEALSMSNRVAVFNNGRLEQVGTPRQVYESPQTTFVATFVGTSNVLSAEQSRAPPRRRRRPLAAPRACPPRRPAGGRRRGVRQRRAARRAVPRLRLPRPRRPRRRQPPARPRVERGGDGARRSTAPCA